MKGIYLLVIELDHDEHIEVGSLGELEFQNGLYVYVGSAQNGVESRVKRHLRDEKKKHWHIDYLLDHAEISKVYALQGDKKDECATARYVNYIATPVPDFGASDCSCNSHLFRYEGKRKYLYEGIENLPGVEEMKLESLQ
ncbi:MAG: GIY-YIG nuclease family protein [Thermoplasmata archaeon]